MKPQFPGQLRNGLVPRKGLLYHLQLVLHAMARALLLDRFRRHGHLAGGSIPPLT